jgi:hypothetical protein
LLGSVTEVWNRGGDIKVLVCQRERSSIEGEIDNTRLKGNDCRGNLSLLNLQGMVESREPQQGSRGASPCPVAGNGVGADAG